MSREGCQGGVGGYTHTCNTGNDAMVDVKTQSDRHVYEGTTMIKDESRVTTVLNQSYTLTLFTYNMFMGSCRQQASSSPPHPNKASSTQQVHTDKNIGKQPKTKQNPQAKRRQGHE